MCNKNFKYAVFVEQSHGFMTDEPVTYLWKQNDIEHIHIPRSFYTQIGKHPNSVTCKNLFISPSGLNFPIYISRDDRNLELEQEIVRKLRSVVRGENKTVTIELSLDELGDGNYQRITFHRMRGH